MYGAFSFCKEDELPIENAKQTLFVSPVIATEGGLTQKSWLIDIEISRVHHAEKEV